MPKVRQKPVAAHVAVAVKVLATSEYYPVGRKPVLAIPEGGDKIVSDIEVQDGVVSVVFCDGGRETFYGGVSVIYEVREKNDA